MICLFIKQGSTVELPWAVEGELTVGVAWFYMDDVNRVKQAIAMDSSSPSQSSSSAAASSLSTPLSSSSGSLTNINNNNNPNLKFSWGSKYELVNDGVFGSNLRLINLSLSDSGHYIAESTQSARLLRVKYTIRVRGIMVILY